MINELNRFTTHMSTLFAGRNIVAQRPSSEFSSALTQAARQLASREAYVTNPWNLAKVCDWSLPFAQFAEALDSRIGLSSLPIGLSLNHEVNSTESWLGIWSQFNRELPRFFGKAVNDLAHALTMLKEARQRQGNPLEAIGRPSNPLLGVNFTGSRLENSMSQLSTSIINSWARTQTITWQSSPLVGPFQRFPSLLLSQKVFTHTQIKEISKFDSLINTRDRQPYFISPSIFSSSSILATLPQPQTITWHSSPLGEQFQRIPSLLLSQKVFTHTQIKEISKLDSLINTRDRQPYFISPSIFSPSSILATLPQPETITSYFAQNAIGAGVTAPIRSLLLLEIPTLPAPPNHQQPSIRVLMASQTQRSPPKSATASTASPINVQGGIHVHITTESIDREHTTETSRLIASQVLKELDRIAQQNRFRRGLPTSPFL